MPHQAYYVLKAPSLSPQCLLAHVSGEATLVGKTDGSKSLELSGVSANLAVLGLTLTTCKLSAKATLPSNGGLTLNSLDFGGAFTSDYGSGKGNFTYDKSATNFTLSFLPAFPTGSPFDAVSHHLLNISDMKILSQSFPVGSLSLRIINESLS